MSHGDLSSKKVCVTREFFEETNVLLSIKQLSNMNKFQVFKVDHHATYKFFYLYLLQLENDIEFDIYYSNDNQETGDACQKNQANKKLPCPASSYNKTSLNQLAKAKYSSSESREKEPINNTKTESCEAELQELNIVVVFDLL